jgi:hypothetical protein
MKSHSTTSATRAIDRVSRSALPLLPLVLDNVPPELVTVLKQEGVPYVRATDPRARGAFVLFDSRLGPIRPLRFGQMAIDLRRLTGPEGDPLDTLRDEGSASHRFHVGGLTFSEEIARVDRREQRRRVIDRLRERIEDLGGVWVTVSPFPFPYRSALNLRIDYDRYQADDFAATLDGIKGHEEATSHFVCGAAYERQPDALHRLAGLDVGSHGYHHHTYRSEDENYQNICRGIDVLRAAGIEPSGFAAPGGRFHRGLLNALERLGVGHSSEFGLAYDDLPFLPGRSDVLQIPIHPVCLGLFLEAAAAGGKPTMGDTQRAVQTAVDYFRQTARAKYRAGEPVFFYGHPTGRLGRFPQVLGALFDTADGFAAVWQVSLTRFAEWWRQRAGIRLTVEREGAGYLVRAEGRPRRFRPAIEYWRGHLAARMPLEENVVRFSPSALAYEQRTTPPLVRPVPIDRPEGIRSRIRRWIDWEQETPVDEICPTGWRNWAKRTLRKLRT